MNSNYTGLHLIQSAWCGTWMKKGCRDGDLKRPLLGALEHGWIMTSIIYIYMYMVCHPNPIDELPHFSGGLC